MSHVCKRIFKIQALIKQLLTKYQIFTILPQISHFHKYRNFSSIFETFETNCFIPINLMAGTCQEYSFSFFASCHPLRLGFRRAFDGTVSVGKEKSMCIESAMNLLSFFWKSKKCVLFIKFRLQCTIPFFKQVLE